MLDAGRWLPWSDFRVQNTDVRRQNGRAGACSPFRFQNSDVRCQMFNAGLGGQSRKADVTFFLPLTREVARAQRVTEGETNQMPARVVAGFPGQNSELRNQMSERVVAGLCACRAQFDTDTRPGCDENKINHRRGGTPCPPEHSSVRTHAPAVQKIKSQQA